MRKSYPQGTENISNRKSFPVSQKREFEQKFDQKLKKPEFLLFSAYPFA